MEWPNLIIQYSIDYLITEGSLEANSETMGHKSVPVPSYALSERSRLNPGLGTTVGSTLLFSITARFGDIKQQSNCLFSFSYSIQITI